MCVRVNAGGRDITCTVQGSQIQALARCKGPKGPPLPARLAEIITPMNEAAWHQELSGHPDSSLVQEILHGVRSGFRVGYDHVRAPLMSRSTNMKSAAEHERVVSEYLAHEVDAGRVVLAGSTQQAAALGIHCSPFGVIPKKSKPGKFRLILNLSAPEGASVNDGISKELAMLAYVSLDEVAETAAKLGPGSWLAKMDIMQAYRQILVHPQDRRLLGMAWDGKVYVDTTLPFGLRSAPLLFTAVAMTKHGAAHVFHYVDDFITLGASEAECSQNSKIMHDICAKAGATSGCFSRPTPFQPALNSHHHSMSDLASLLSLTKCSSLLVDADSSIGRLVKVLPALTTLHAWPRTPISESSSRFLQAFLPRHPASSASIRANLSFGSLSSMATVSISIPRIVRHMVGPSSFVGSGDSPCTRVQLTRQQLTLWRTMLTWHLLGCKFKAFSHETAMVQVGLQVPTPLAVRKGLFSCELLARLQELFLHGSQCLLSAQASWLCQVRVTA